MVHGRDDNRECHHQREQIIETRNWGTLTCARALDGWADASSNVLPVIERRLKAAEYCSMYIHTYNMYLRYI